ncbi:MAG: response regulator transcription factor [Bacillota bacterium]|nr:response regulator transcription factor [Bacillota bacterium]
MDDSKIKLLVIDDDLVLLEQVEGILRPTYEVSLAASGEQAVAFLKEGEAPHLILLDLLMPHMDGCQTLSEIRKIEACAEVPVIFLTGIISPDMEVRCLEKGAVDYITKPFSSQVLLARVSLALRNVNRFLSADEIDGAFLASVGDKLNRSEIKVLKLMVKAYSNKEIAAELNYSYDYVKKLASQVLNKLQVESRNDLKKFRKGR